MACKESCTHNPDQEVRASIAMISEQWIGTLVDSRPAILRELKTYVNAETQTEPFVYSPVVEVLTPRTKCTLVEKDLAYCTKKSELQPMHSEPSFMPKQNTKDNTIQEPDSFDDKSDADSVDAGTDYD